MSVQVDAAPFIATMIAASMIAPVIAIDGPAAAGKGTLARQLAVALGLRYLDTGLLYRAVGRRVLNAGKDPADAAAAEEAAKSLRAADLDRDDLRGPEADAASSKVAAHAGVRAALLDFQRRFGREGGGSGAVLDGRDIGTVVFPDAAVKLFVTASAEERARRRWRDQRGQPGAATLEQVLQGMAVRDARDAGRGTAPMRPAPDAAVLDTTDLDADAAFSRALDIVRTKLELHPR